MFSKKGCATGLLLLLGVCGFSIWRLGEPFRRASAAYTQIRPGMTLPEVYAASGRWWSSSGADCGGAAEPLSFYSATEFGNAGSGELVLNRRRPGAAKNALDAIVSEGMRYASRAELLKLIDRTPSLSTCKQVGFTYLVPGVPPRTSFGVSFADGRVTRVSEPRSWD